MEPLQARMLLSATLEDGVLTIRGTEGDDVIHVWGGGYRPRSQGMSIPQDVHVSYGGRSDEVFESELVNQIVILGGGGNDSISDSSSWSLGVTLSGEGGNDQIRTYRNNRTILGGAGDDRVETRGDLASIDHGPGRDTVMANLGRDVLAGEARLEFRHGTLRIFGSDGDDSLRIDAFWVPASPPGVFTPMPRRHYVYVEFNGFRLYEFPARRIVAHMGEGNDFVEVPGYTESQGSIFQKEFVATLFGGAGDDTLIGNSGDDYIAGGDGDDSIAGGWGDDILLGQKGTDFIEGRLGADTIAGGAGRDVLNGGRGDDVIWGDRLLHEIVASEGRDVINRDGFGPSETGLRKLDRSQ